MKKILMSISTIAAVSLVVTAATGAFFSDSATTTVGTFSSGTLSIDDSKVTSTSTTLNIPNMAPGEVTGPYSVVIENNGDMNLGWLGDWQFTGGNGAVDLKNAIYIDSAKMEFLSPNGDDWLDDPTSGYESDGADIFIQDGTGHGPYASWFTSVAAAATPFHLVSLNAFNDNPGMVPGSVYEHAGALKPHYKYRLTVTFGMAPAAGNDYQNLGPVTAKLQVNATQINASALIDQGVPAASAPGIKDWMDAQIADQTES